MNGDGPHLVDPRPGRYQRLSDLMGRVLLVAAVLALVTVLLPAEYGRWTGGALVLVLIGAPLYRVAWFAARWVRRGDRRYAAVAIGVLTVVVAGFLLS